MCGLVQQVKLRLAPMMASTIPGGGSGVPVEDCDVALVDLDGVVYLGAQPIPHAAESLTRAASCGMTLAYVTNNAARTPLEVATHLKSLGAPADPEQVVTSAQAGAALVRSALGPGPWPVLAVGGPGVAAALRVEGLHPVVSADAQPAAVLQGFGRDLCWSDLDEAATAVGRGVLWIATNPDTSIPTQRGHSPGNGAFVQAVSVATGRQPDAVAGKPFAPLMEQTMARTGAKQPLVIGDRLDTDIEAAHVVGVRSLVVLTGIATPAQILAAAPHQRPDLIGVDLRTLFDQHPPIERSHERWVSGSSTISIDPSSTVLNLDGPLATTADWANSFRLLCQATWTTGVETTHVLARLEGVLDHLRLSDAR